MGLETGTYISDLVASNPVNATDQVGEGDDHMRLIKSTILNTFPNITGEVSLSHTQLNDAALKSAENQFSAINHFGSTTYLENTTVLEHDVQLRGRLADLSTLITMLRLSTGDTMDIGAGTNSYLGNRYIVGSARTHSIEVGADVVAVALAPASGSLQIADSGGVLGNVAAVHIANTFAETQTFEKNVAVENNFGCVFFETGGVTARFGMRLDGGNRLAIGEDAIPEVRQRALNFQTFYIGGSAVMQLLPQAGGGALVWDRNGEAKKVGFRNPSNNSGAPRAFTQSDEDTVVVSTAAGTWLVPALEEGTQITIRVINAAVTIQRSGITNLLLADGTGVTKNGDFTVNNGSVLTLYWRASNTVDMWGNGAVLV